MEAYTGFAEVYDEFMDNIDYKKWCNYLIELLNEQGIKDGTIVDLGCGTGNVTQILAENGFDVIGIDISEEMLEIASEKYMETQNDCEEGGQIIYVCQDMCELQLPYSVNAMVSICDSVNYIVAYEELVQVMKNVKSYLNKEGIFIFDLKTGKYFSDIGEAVIAEEREQCSFIWGNFFDEQHNINEYRLALFIEGEDGRYDKFVEEHYQRAYLLEEIEQAAKESGLTVMSMYNAFTKETANEENDRIYVILKNEE